LYEIAKQYADHNESEGAIITGNPGIGKSWFLSYCLFNLAQEKRTVFFESVARDKAWLFTPDTLVEEFNPLRDEFPPETADPRTIYLFDPATKTRRQPRNVKAFTIVASSPNPNNYHDLSNRTNNAKFYMPCWNWEEVSSTLNFLPQLDRNTVKDRFDKYGGKPRYIFTIKDTWHTALEDAIATTDIEDLKQSAGNLEAVRSASHKILKYDVDISTEYQEHQVSYASEYIADRMSHKLLTNMESQTLDFLRISADLPLIASVRGTLFERYVHNVLQRPGKWRVRALSSQDSQEELPINNKHINVFDSLAQVENLQEGVYYRPKKKNYGAVDAVTKVGNDISLFQVTVSLGHGINTPELVKCLDELGEVSGKIRLYFVVPVDVFPEFKHQSYNQQKDIPREKLAKAKEIEQWVLEMPLSPKQQQ